MIRTVESRNISVSREFFEQLEDILQCDERFTDSGFNLLILFTPLRKRLNFVIGESDALSQSQRQ